MYQPPPKFVGANTSLTDSNSQNMQGFRGIKVTSDVSFDRSNINDSTELRRSNALNRENSTIMLSSFQPNDFASNDPVVLVDDVLVAEGGGGKRTRRHSEDFVLPNEIQEQSRQSESPRTSRGLQSFCGSSTIVGPLDQTRLCNNDAGSSFQAFVKNASSHTAASPLALSRKVSGGLSPIISSATSIHSTSTISEAVHMDIRSLRFDGNVSKTESTGTSPQGRPTSINMQQSMPQFALDLQSLQNSTQLEKSSVVWLRTPSGTLVPQNCPKSARIERTFTGSSQGNGDSTSQQGNWVVLGPYSEIDSSTATKAMFGSFSHRDDHSSTVSNGGSDVADPAYFQYPTPSSQNSVHQFQQSYHQELQVNQQLQQLHLQQQQQLQQQQLQLQQQQQQAMNMQQPQNEQYSQDDQHQHQMGHVDALHEQSAQQKKSVAVQKSFFESQQALQSASAIPNQLPDDVTTIPKSLVRSRRDALQRHLEQQWLLSQLQQQQQQGVVSAQLLHQQELVARANQKWGTGTASINNQNTQRSNGGSNSDAMPSQIESVYSMPTSKPGLVPANSTPALGGFAGSKWFAPMYPTSNSQKMSSKEHNEGGGIQAYRVRLYGHRPEVIYEPIILQPGQTYDSSTTIIASKLPAISANISQVQPSVTSNNSKLGKPPLAQPPSDAIDRRPLERERSIKAMEEVLRRVTRDRAEELARSHALYHNPESHLILANNEFMHQVTTPMSTPQILPQMDNALGRPGSASPRSSFSISSSGIEMPAEMQEGLSSSQLVNMIEDLDSLATASSSPSSADARNADVIDKKSNSADPALLGTMSGQISPAFTSISQRGVQSTQSHGNQPIIHNSRVSNSRRRENTSNGRGSATSNEPDDTANVYVSPSTQGGIPTRIRKDGLTLQMDSLSETLTKLKISHVRANGPKLVQIAATTLSSLSEQLQSAEDDLKQTKCELENLSATKQSLESAIADANNMAERSIKELERTQIDLKKKEEENLMFSKLIASQQDEIKKLKEVIFKQQSAIEEQRCTACDATFKCEKNNRDPAAGDMIDFSGSTFPRAYSDDDGPLAVGAVGKAKDSPSVNVAINAGYETLSVNSSLASIPRFQNHSFSQSTTGATATALGIIAASELSDKLSSETKADSVHETGLIVTKSHKSESPIVSQADKHVHLKLTDQTDTFGQYSSEIHNNNFNESVMEFMRDNPLSASPIPDPSLSMQSSGEMRRKTLMGLQPQKSDYQCTLPQLHRESSITFDSAPQTAALAAARARFARSASSIASSPFNKE